MKYQIPQDKLDKIVFKYLDIKLSDLEKYKSKNYNGIVYKRPNEEYGVLGWKKPDILFIYYKLIGEISSIFSLGGDDSEAIIGRWASDRLQIEVKDALISFYKHNSAAEDRL